MISNNYICMRKSSARTGNHACTVPGATIEGVEQVKCKQLKGMAYDVLGNCNITYAFVK